MFAGTSINMLLPVRLCPGRFPMAMLPRKRSLPFTLQNGNPVTLQISSIGNVVRPGKYITSLGPSLTMTPGQTNECTKREFENTSGVHTSSRKPMKKVCDENEKRKNNGRQKYF